MTAVSYTEAEREMLEEMRRGLLMQVKAIDKRLSQLPKKEPPKALD